MGTIGEIPQRSVREGKIFWNSSKNTGGFNRFFVWENVEIGHLFLKAAANVTDLLEAKPFNLM